MVVRRAHHDTHQQPNHNAQDQQSSDADQYGERRHLIIEEQQRDVHTGERQCGQTGGHHEVEAGLQAGLEKTSPHRFLPQIDHHDG